MLFGTEAGDTIAALAGDDLVFGAGGDDVLDGGMGNDELRDDHGNNVFDGGPGDDQLRAGIETVNFFAGGTGADTVDRNGSAHSVIAFNRGDWCDQLQTGMTLDLAVQPSINEYKGYRNVELEIKDCRLPA